MTCDLLIDDRIDIIGLFGWLDASGFLLFVKVYRVFHQLTQKI